MADETLNSVELATELTIAWLGNQNNRVAPEDVPTFLRTMHSTILELGRALTAPTKTLEQAPSEPEYVPAVTARKSLASKDHIISMIDGKPYKTLRRHLSTHGLTDVQYRERYNLRSDYPMVAESYSEARRAMAHKIGLGQKGRAAKTKAQSAAAAAPTATARKRGPRKVPVKAQSH
ncbi:Ros/MucR family transcriptional regulator [Sphingomonas immobilis]|uniref:MucR family transcriptional regulator n=1 Tax=Sphingomonas immobilis TaxID=3063997 RepID=A0ABT8ZZH2_9SPHN|nr:MucR family transcriptional regulator [Sphingomonas sp. CA1-15]MDO7841852.1 MucR family transcriptional regulator [Sphingomonas sp. CA1-15]